MTANHGTLRRVGRLPRAYVGTWVVLAGVSISYLALLAARPDVVASVTLTPPTHLAGAAVDAGQDVRSLKQTVSALEGEIQALRTSITSREDSERALAARLAAIESRGSSEIQPTRVATTIEPVTRPEGEELVGRTVAGRVEEGLARAPVAPPAPPAAQPKTIAFGTPQVTPSRPSGLVIATGPSVDALRLSWMLLSDRHKGVLKDLEPRFVATGGPGTPAYRLVVGPVANDRAAQRLCSQLRARRVTCGITGYAGEPL